MKIFSLVNLKGTQKKKPQGYKNVFVSIYIKLQIMWKTKDKKGSKIDMTNKNFCPISSQMWITQGGGYQLANNKFVATNLSHKTPNFCSKNSLKNQTILKAKIYKFLLKNQSFLNVKSYKNLIESRYFSNFKNINFYFRNIKHNIKNLIYFRHILNVSFRVYCRRLNTKFLYNQYNLSKIPKYNILIKSFLPRLQE